MTMLPLHYIAGTTVGPDVSLQPKAPCIGRLTVREARGRRSCARRLPRERRAGAEHGTLQAATTREPYVNAGLREMLPDVAPICGGYVKDHVANLGRLNGATAQFTAWKAIVVAGPSDAAGRLNKLTQERMGVHDLSDYNLMAMAFDPKPPQKRRPRLRCPHSPSPDSKEHAGECAPDRDGLHDGDPQPVNA
jgi:hypothetical protein